MARHGLIRKEIINSRGIKTHVWVREDDPNKKALTISDIKSAYNDINLGSRGDESIIDVESKYFQESKDRIIRGENSDFEAKWSENEKFEIADTRASAVELATKIMDVNGFETIDEWSNFNPEQDPDVENLLDKAVKEFHDESKNYSDIYLSAKENPISSLSSYSGRVCKNIKDGEIREVFEMIAAENSGDSSFNPKELSEGNLYNKVLGIDNEKGGGIDQVSEEIARRHGEESVGRSLTSDLSLWIMEDDYRHDLKNLTNSILESVRDGVVRS